jgi:hypothetical protein
MPNYEVYNEKWEAHSYQESGSPVFSILLVDFAIVNGFYPLRGSASLRRKTTHSSFCLDLLLNLRPVFCVIYLDMSMYRGVLWSEHNGRVRTE